MNYVNLILDVPFMLIQFSSFVDHFVGYYFTPDTAPETNNISYYWFLFWSNFFPN